MRHLLLIALSVWLQSCDGSQDPYVIDGGINPDGSFDYRLEVKPLGDEGIYFLNAADVPDQENSFAWGLPAKHLKADPNSGVVMQVDIASGWSAASSLIFAHALEVIVLGGAIDFGDVQLSKWDYARFSGGTVTQPESANGAQLLLFFDGAAPMVVGAMGKPPTEPEAVVKAAESPWVAGTAMADAGRDDVPLKIKHYKNDPETGARTYLVAVAPGVTIPWESHKIAEEVYVLEGDYTLAECLPSGKAEGTYTAGGYFYRPPGIAHNGPTSGTKTGTVMLIRTPGPLTVDLVEGC